MAGLTPAKEALQFVTRFDTMARRVLLGCTRAGRRQRGPYRRCAILPACVGSRRFRSPTEVRRMRVRHVLLAVLFAALVAMSAALPGSVALAADLDDRPRHRRHVDGPALSQPDAEQQRRAARVRPARAAQREGAARARPRHRVEGDRPDDVGVQAAARREVPRRQRLHRRRRARVDQPRAEGAEQPVAVHRVHQADREDGGGRPVHRCASRRRRRIR